MKLFSNFIAEVETITKSGSGKEKKFYNQFYRGGENVEDHDTDPANWTEANVGKSNTEINAKATPGDQSTPKVDCACVGKCQCEPVIADELPMKKYSGKGSKAVAESQEDVRDVYRDEIDELIEDISDLHTTLIHAELDNYTAKATANRLREVRDYLLGAIGPGPAADNVPATQSESHKATWGTSEDVRDVLVDIQEAFDSGIVKLHDGNEVMVEAMDAAILHVMFEDLTENSATKLMNVMVSSKADFHNVLEYAKSTISETSKERAEKYLQRAISDHGMANFARRSTEGQPGKEKEAEFWKRKEKNRKEGISRAIDKGA